MNYIQRIRMALSNKISVEPQLLDLYTLLVFTTGVATTLEHVHDAWSVWKNTINDKHPALIPFSELTKEKQELDQEYAAAIIETALQVNQ